MKILSTNRYTNGPSFFEIVRLGESFLAVWTGLEPATPCVTGRYSNQLNYHTIFQRAYFLFESECKDRWFYCNIQIISSFFLLKSGFSNKKGCFQLGTPYFYIKWNFITKKSRKHLDVTEKSHTFALAFGKEVSS